MRPVSSVTSRSARGPSSSSDLEPRHRLARGRRVERVARLVGAVAADRRLDPPRARAQRALHEREIAPLDVPAPDRLLQPLVRLVGARDDEQAGGVAVEAVHDPGPVLVAAGGVVLDQPVHERSRRVPDARMDDDSRRLVDDQQVLVLPGDVQVHRLRLERRSVRRQLDDDVLPALQPVALDAGLAVDEDGAARDQPLGERARAHLRPAGDRAVEALGLRGAKAESCQLGGAGASLGRPLRGLRRGWRRRRR